jgi:multiple sugar transport system permease protein
MNTAIQSNAKSQRREMSRMFSSNRLVHRYINPRFLTRLALALLWFVVALFPIWWMISIVFSKPGIPIAIDPRLYPSSLSSGMDNLQAVYEQASFVRSFLISCLYASTLVAGMLVICSMAAFEFALFDFPGKNTLFLLALTALMIPQAVTLIPTYRIVVKLGWLNSLQGLAVPGMASAFSLFVLKQFMEDLPAELLEAAHLDGATHFGTYWRIALPLSKNALLTVGVLSFVHAWGNYMWPLVVATKPDWYPMSLTVASFFGAQSYHTVNEVMAAALISAVPPILLYVFLQRYIVEGIALSGLKG